MPKKNNYAAAKKRYITSNLTMQQLADETGISVNMLRKIAAKEKWKADRTKEGKKKVKKIITKTTERASSKIADTLIQDMTSELSAAEKLLKVIHKALDDSEQFNRHLITVKDEGTDEKGANYKKQYVIEQQFKKLDIKEMQSLANTLQTVEGVHRRTSGILTKLEQSRLNISLEQLAIEREKLEIAKERDGKGTGEENTGIVYMPSIDVDQYKHEQQEYLKSIGEDPRIVDDQEDKTYEE